MMIMCTLCGVIYSHRQSLNRHVKASHPSHIVPSAVCLSARLLCTECESETHFKSRMDFLQHLATVHGVTGDHSIIKVFDSVEDFLAWKTIMERENLACYVLARTSKNKNYRMWVYNCNRSGYYTPKGKGLRELKAQGSRKICGYCPSGLKVKVTLDGKCSVTFFTLHWGHGTDLRHLPLTTCTELQIAAAAELDLELPHHTKPQSAEGENGLSSLERFHCLAEVRSGAKRDRMKTLRAKKRNFFALMSSIVTLIENATRIEEVVSATKLIIPIPHVMAVARRSATFRMNAYQANKRAKKKASEPASTASS